MLAQDWIVIRYLLLDWTLIAYVSYLVFNIITLNVASIHSFTLYRAHSRVGSGKQGT